METIKNYSWAGNVRELENVLQEAVALAKEDVLEKESFIFGNLRNNDNNNRDIMSLCDVEKEHIKLVLDKVRWDKKEACRILKISRPTLNKKIKDNDIQFSNTIISVN